MLEPRRVVLKVRPLGPAAATAPGNWEPANYANSWTTPDLRSEKLWWG